jgi:hypothetical protein
MRGDDVVGEKVIHYREDYNRWMEKLEEQLKEVTRWRGAYDKQGEDSLTSKFGDAKTNSDLFKQADRRPRSLFQLLNSRIEIKGKLGFVNLLPSTYQEVKGNCQTFDSDWFVDIMSFLVNSVPEKSGHAGIVIFEGKNAVGKDYIFIKIRRAVDFSGVDLPTGEDKIKELFGDLYMGGGGHAGAVSF